MKELISQLRKNNLLLPLVTIIALVVHISGIFYLHGMKVQYDSPRMAYFENQKDRKDLDKDFFKKRDLKRQEELEVVFNRLVEKPLSPSDLNFDSTADHTSSIDENPTIDEMVDSSSNESEPEPVELADVSHELPSITIDTAVAEEIVQDPIDIKEAVSVLVIPSDNLETTSELVQATSTLQGEILLEDMESLKTAEGIKVGVDENASLTGTALQNKSGLLDQGDDSSLVNAVPKILPSVDVNPDDNKKPIASNQYRQIPEGTLLSPQVLLETSEVVQYDVSVPRDERIPDEAGEPNMSDEMASIASSDDFNLDVVYSPLQNNKGYVFKATFVPKVAANFKRIRQNLFFLIDRSHSISNERYEYTKQAVGNALSLMNAGDTFNILVFDDKVVRMSDKNLPWTRSNVEYARKFLAQQEHGGFFATTDIYSSLGKIVPGVVASNEVNIAILLSDGDTYLRRDLQRKTIGSWTRKNHGKISLFCVASGRGNNLALLELLSSFNKGKLVYAPTHESLEKSLLRLINGISTPIGKDIVATAIPSNEAMRITVYPRRGQLPDLYENQPYVLYGVVDQLEDFHIFIQGRYYGKWLDIKHKLSFKSAQRGGDLLERSLVVYRAYDHYYRFLSDGDFKQLAAAKKLLKPLNIQMAFQ